MSGERFVSVSDLRGIIERGCAEYDRASDANRDGRNTYDNWQQMGRNLIAARRVLDAAPDLVKRRRCATHDAEIEDHCEDACWKSVYLAAYGDSDCRFVTVYEVPVDE